MEESSTSRPGCLTLGEIVSGIHWTGGSVVLRAYRTETTEISFLIALFRYQQQGPNSCFNVKNGNIGCSFCRPIRCPEHVIGRHWYLPADWKSFIRSDQWVSQCYAIECDISFCCALLCVFMTRVSQCPISLRAEHTLYTDKKLSYSRFGKKNMTRDIPLWNNLPANAFGTPQLNQVILGKGLGK
jgi:hypothetical protein